MTQSPVTNFVTISRNGFVQQQQPMSTQNFEHHLQYLRDLQTNLASKSDLFDERDISHSCSNSQYLAVNKLPGRQTRPKSGVAMGQGRNRALS